MKTKRILALLICLLTLTITVQAQDSLATYYNQYPQEAIKEADILYRQAIKERNTPLLLRAIILKNHFSLEIDNSRQEQILQELYNYTGQEKDTVAKSILQSYLAELYLAAYRKNTYAVKYRRPQKGYIPNNIKEWSSNIFHEKIIDLYMSSIASQHILQQTPISLYDTILFRGNDSPTLRPTLYDFLCYRAIDALSLLDYYSFGHTPALDSEDFPGYLSPLDKFVRLDIPLDIENNRTYILNIFQQLLAFREEAGDPAALLLADLDRLKYAYRISPNKMRDSLYGHTLEYMAQKYASFPIVVEVWNLQAELLLQYSYGTSNTKIPFSTPSTEEELKQKALEICESGIRKFPKYQRINLLHQTILNIKNPTLTVQFKKTLYPGKDMKVNIEFKNIPEIYIQIHKIASSTPAYIQASKKDLPQTLVYQQSIQLNNKLINQDTSFHFPIKETGLYQLSINATDSASSTSGYFVCTQLFTTQQILHDQYRFMVRDQNSGQPVKGAKILIYDSPKPGSRLVIDSTFTDKAGIALVPHQGREYQVVNKNNPNGIICSIQNTYYPGNNISTPLVIITDRKIYRPGQTVYFKGITWQATSDTLFAVNKRYIALSFRDANNKEISQQNFVTNQFGSFSGSFVIPSHTMNGTFRISGNDGGATITVSEYKRPEFEISFTKPGRIFAPGDSIRLQGLVSSFSGARINNTKVNYEITQDYIYPYREKNMDVEQGVVTTNDKGEFELRFKADLPASTIGFRGYYYYQVKAHVTDAKGETQEGNTMIPVFGGQYQPAIEIPEYINKNQPTAFHIYLKDFEPDSSLRDAEYTIARLRSPAQPLIDNNIQDTIIEQTILRGKLKLGRADSLVPDMKSYKPGAYLFTVECDGVTSKSIFYLYSSQDKRPPISTYSWLIEEKTQCRLGESARILFGTSLRNTYVTYEIYANNRLIKSVHTILSDEIMPITIPYEASFGNEAWLAIHYIKNENYITKIIPIRRLHEEKQLTLTTKVFRDKLMPGENETWEIHINKGTSGKVNAEMLAMMYDASLDKLQDYNIQLTPSYIYRPFINGWNRCYQAHNPAYLYLPFPYDMWKKYSVDPFSFDQLNVFSIPSAEVYSFGNAISYQSYSLNEEKISSSMDYGKRKRNDKQQFQIGTGDTKVNPRQNFQETAFFYPQLYPDSAGNVFLKFTMPESVTRWKFSALAHTPDMASGELVRYVTTSRPLMVRSNIPRFLRSGDQTEIKAVISNLSDSTLHGLIDFELFTPLNEQTLIRHTAEFTVGARENNVQSFKFKVPQDIDLAGCRIIAHSNQFSDGEQQLIPILPDETLITQTKNIYTTAAGTHTFTLTPGSSVRKDYRLTLEIASNPVWYAVLAMPSLSEPLQDNVTDIAGAYYANTIGSMIARTNPEIKKALQQWAAKPNNTTLLSQLNQHSELKSILLEASPWVTQAQSETEQIQSLASLFDLNRLEYLQHQALKKLSILQSDKGAWSWFKGMYPSRFMTCNVLLIMARANTIGQYEYNNDEKTMQIKGLRYLDHEINRDFRDKQNQINHDQLLYLYVRSMYRDIPLGDALDAHKYYMALAEKQWVRFSLYEKAITAIAMLNYGKTETCQSILKSLRQYAVSSPEQGMYWPNNRNNYNRHSAVQVHVAIMEAFFNGGANSADIEKMKQWLLLQKQTQSWSGVPATVDAIYALLLTGNNSLDSQDFPRVRIGQQELKTDLTAYPLGYIKKSYLAEEIKPDMLTVSIDKTMNTPTWGGLYLQYFEKYSRIKKAQDGLRIDKKLFIEVRQSDGTKILQPMGSRQLQIGDKIIVRLTLSLSRDMEFLHLKDLHAACLEPTEQLSGNYWQGGMAYYQEIKDACTNFFFNALSRGTYVIEYPMWINQSGEYQDGIATFQSIYAPAFNAFSEATRISIK